MREEYPHGAGLPLRSESWLLGPPLQIPQAEVSESTLVMQIYDFNRFSKHDIIGEVRLPLASVDLQHVIEQWSDLAVASKVEVGPGGWETLLGGMCSFLACHHLKKQALRGKHESFPLRKPGASLVFQPQVSGLLCLVLITGISPSGRASG